MKVHCIRHGQSEYNILGLCNDDPSRNVRLTELGRRQAALAAERIAGLAIECIYCSELPRTQETARLLIGVHGVAIQINPMINDIRTGCDGKPASEYFRAIQHDKLNARIGNGETLREHKTRIEGFLQWLKAQPYREVLIVAHEETLRVFAAHARRLSELEMLQLSFDNCELLSFTLE